MAAPLALDHLVIAAAELASGAAAAGEMLGFDIPPGGEHPLMATHNHLARLGADTFVEVIAPDPAATPARARWFGLDRPPRTRGWQRS